MASTSPPLSQQGLILVHTEKLKLKGPIAKKNWHSDISHVALASILLGENPSGEVDDYDNYYYYLEKWFPLRGERARSLKLFCMYDKRFEISKTK